MEIMGSVDSGIHAMCWSPDQDLVVLVTGNKVKNKNMYAITNINNRREEGFRNDSRFRYYYRISSSR